jgi:Trypsin-like peptidase domain
MAVAEPSLASLAVSVRFKRKELGTATAFVVGVAGDFYLVTNWHVVTGRDPNTGRVLSKNGAVPDRLAVMHHVLNKPGHWQHRIHTLYDDNDDPLWLEHPVHRRSVDVVALPISQPRGARFVFYDLHRPGPLISFAPSNTVSIIGFPFAISGGGGLGVWVQGTVATEPSLDYWDLPLLLVDSRTRPGQSGSPVIVYRTDGYITEDGGTINNHIPAQRLIGVYSGRINEESDLGLVWKLGALAEIVAAQHRGPLPTLAKP